MKRKKMDLKESKSVGGKGESLIFSLYIGIRK
jgi:hypothetical protein